MLSITTGGILGCVVIPDMMANFYTQSMKECGANSRDVKKQQGEDKEQRGVSPRKIRCRDLFAGVAKKMLGHLGN
jgi:hypothetical protein